jgi:hypothetical protein
VGPPEVLVRLTDWLITPSRSSKSPWNLCGVWARQPVRRRLPCVGLVVGEVFFRPDLESLGRRGVRSQLHGGRFETRGRPLQLMEMRLNMRCSILFHFDVAGGWCETVISSPVYLGYGRRLIIRACSSRAFRGGAARSRDLLIQKRALKALEKLVPVAPHGSSSRAHVPL